MMNIYKLKDICTIKSGKRIPLGMDFSTTKTDYPYIRARDIKGGKIQTEDLIYIDFDVYNKIKKYIINENDIAITIVGASIGDVSYAQKEVDGYNLTENAIRLTNFNTSIVNSKFLFYLISQFQYHEYMQTIAGGAAQPKLGIYKIEKIKVQLPLAETQQKIANILSRYDEAIENNSKRIKLLEQMAQNLYKEWFVRFRFPGYEKIQFKDSSIGKIPETFSVLKQNEVISDYIGGGWGEDEESSNYPIQAAVVRGADFPAFTKGDIATCPVRFHKKSNYESRIISEDDIVLEVSGGTQEQPVGRTVIVTKERLERFNNKLICASFCKLIRLNKKVIVPFYYYYWMQFVYDTRMIDRYQLQSTGIINFKFEYFLRKGDVLLPPADIMWEFDFKAKTIHNQIENLAKANQNLAKQRDLLLPRLMSGKLEV